MSKIWKDHKGATVPTKYVPVLDKQKDRTSRKFLKEAITIQNRLKKFKKEILEKCDSLYQQMLDNAKIEKQHKGNYTITSFDKEVKIEVKMQDKIEFDDHINLAQAKINEFLELKTVGADKDLALLVNQAFGTSKGRMDTKRVLGLFKLEIKHKLWSESMDLIKKSINRNHSKRYVRVFLKNNEGKYEDITLNLSSI